MSGIVGIYQRQGEPVQLEQLSSMVDAIAHRGQDGSQVWHQGSVGLGHLMLHTTRESLIEELPYCDRFTGTAITADARIDNRDELIDLLGLKGDREEKITDSSLILKAYHKWGENCPEKLLGDFAFAIWDSDKQQLFCARDHFGVKPFCYYYRAEDGLVFASEIKAIICLPEIPVKINEVRIGDYLSGNLYDSAITSYHHVWRLPPAHRLIISQEGLQLSRYWSLDPNKQIRLASDAEYAEKFRELFTEAVKCRLRSIFPIGSHLSGGLDSTSVTCIARNILQEKNTQLHTFSNVFESVPECDESEYFNRVIEAGGLIPHFVKADLFGPLSEWSEFFKYIEEPFLSNCYLVWGLNRASKEVGTRVVLTGFDGDTTVSHGVLRLTELARSGKWSTFIEEGASLAKNFEHPAHLILRSYGADAFRELARTGKWLSFLAAVNAVSAEFKMSQSQMIVDYGLKAVVPQSLKQVWYKLRRGRRPAAKSFPLIDANFARQINLQARVKTYTPDSEPLDVKGHQWQQLTSGFFAVPLEISDLHSAAFGIESRHPFMDKRLIEYCFALPSEQKLKQGWSRFVLRQAMKDIIPPEIQYRGGKTNMAPSFQKALLKHNKLLLKEAMLINSALISSYVNTTNLSDIYTKLISKNKLKHNTIDNIWNAVTLYLWLKNRQASSICNSKNK